MPLLITCSDQADALADAQGWLHRLESLGVPVFGAVPCHQLVREVVRLAPKAVLVVAPVHDAALREALALLAGTAACPLLLIGAVPDDDDLPAWLDQHLMAWLPSDATPQAVAGALPLAVAWFARAQAQQQVLAGTQARLEDRKWIDKAKGVLMRAQQLSEEDAFTLLRTASMQTNLRVGEVSRSVIEAARGAEAVNRAGLLRMLSQRHVKGLALRTASRGRGDDLLADTAQRVQRNLDWLGRQTLPEATAGLLEAVRADWRALDALPAPVPPRQGAPVAGQDADAQSAWLLDADARAERLLASAQALTSALETASGRGPLRVVNLGGRQRMLAQRLVKQVLLAGLLPAPLAAEQAQAAAQTVQAFESALVQLEQAPLASEPIRATLAQARGHWQRLLEALRRSDGPDAAAGRVLLARESESLVASFDQLTALYEQSMQVLLG